MNITLAGYEIPVSILDRSNSISPHTDREVEQIKVNVTIRGEEINEKVADYLQSVKKEAIISKEGQITKKWKLNNSSYGFTNTREQVDYTLELEEIEEFKLAKLILDDLELTPYLYEENFDYNNDLTIEGRVLLSEAQFKKVKELMEKDSITIIRQGISERPRQMRLLIDAWSKNEKNIKLQFSLNDLKDDKKLNPLRFLREAINLVIKQDQLIEQLANLLIQKGILKKEEYEGMKTGIPERNWEIELEFNRVKDLDEWEFK